MLINKHNFIPYIFFTLVLLGFWGFFKDGELSVVYIAYRVIDHDKKTIPVGKGDLALAGILFKELRAALVVIVIAHSAYHRHLETRAYPVINAVIPQGAPECNVSYDYGEIDRYLPEPTFAVDIADELKRSAIIDDKTGMVIAEDDKFKVAAFIIFELLRDLHVHIRRRVFLEI